MSRDLLADADYLKKTQAFWDKVRQQQKSSKSSIWCWWSSQVVVSYIGTLLNITSCTKISDFNTGILKQRFGDMVKFDRGISVGCGNGNKELSLAQSGIVKHFTLYELSVESIKETKKNFEQSGYINCIDIVHGDAFKLERNKFDFLLWDN